MNNVSKLYEVYVNRELQITKNEVLNTQRLNQKILSFLPKKLTIGFLWVIILLAKGWFYDENC